MDSNKSNPLTLCPERRANCVANLGILHYYALRRSVFTTLRIPNVSFCIESKAITTNRTEICKFDWTKANIDNIW